MVWRHSTEVIAHIASQCWRIWLYWHEFRVNSGKWNPSIDPTVAQPLCAFLGVFWQWLTLETVVGLIVVCFGGNWHVHNVTISHFFTPNQFLFGIFGGSRFLWGLVEHAIATKIVCSAGWARNKNNMLHWPCVGTPYWYCYLSIPWPLSPPFIVIALPCCWCLPLQWP